MKRTKPSTPAEVTSLGSRFSPIHSARLGTLVGISPEGRPMVDFDGNRTGSLAVVSMLQLSPDEWKLAADRRQGALLLFDGGDPLRPILVGLVPAQADGVRAEGTLPSLPEHAIVDGQRVTIDGKDEIVLRCGKASITLRRNGKVIIRGTFLDSHASGTNRVKGGSVRIN